MIFFHLLNKTKFSQLTMHEKVLEPAKSLYKYTKKKFVKKIKTWKKWKKYSRIKNWHIYFVNTLGQSFPHTSGTSWCVENSDLKFFQIKYVGSLYKISTLLFFTKKHRLTVKLAIWAHIEPTCREKITWLIMLIVG